ncbi:MAG TPA: hypothetical protein VG247_29065, partial [Pseudonocardiaceae bacterium]|nr:hypothetical protein [Pseudonocardiaceae bacterium]
VGGLQPAKRELAVHDRDIQRIQGGRDQGAHRQALAGLRISELVNGWRGAGSANYCCSHLVPPLDDRAGQLPGPPLARIA